MLRGESVKHSAPEWKPLALVVWTVHLPVSSAVPLNSSSKLQIHRLPSALRGAEPPQDVAISELVPAFAGAERLPPLAPVPAMGAKARPAGCPECAGAGDLTDR